MCWCRFVTPIPTRTRVVLLQHPRERDVAIGTARMASLCLPESSLHVGVSWDRDAGLAAALADPARPPILLYPGPGARDLAVAPPPGPVTLVVVDGTWSQTKTLVRDNRCLAALPRYAFVPPRPSEYRIRKEPSDHHVSTIEALMHVLGVLEGEPERFAAMLQPFRAMVDMQLQHIERHRARRSKLPRQRVRRSPLPAVLHERAPDVLCVYAEANAWPHGSPNRPRGSHGELVHWLAVRPHDGTRFDMILAPRGPLAPRVSAHIELSPELITAGVSPEAFLDAWAAFVRDDDVLVCWGGLAMTLLRQLGGRMPATRVDLRPIAAAITRSRAGAIDGFAARMTEHAAPAAGRGRGGRRLEHLRRILSQLLRTETGHA
ncbi:MAG: DTW domain-containing protein [Nannocystaceae bacterium]|nr:DTW domain-containing protein [Nannocystaceae bacterium]